jgi:hypothetical protein
MKAIAADRSTRKCTISKILANRERVFSRKEMATEASIRQTVKAWLGFFFLVFSFSFPAVCLCVCRCSRLCLACWFLVCLRFFSRNESARKKDRDAETIDIKRIDNAKAILKLEYIDEGGPLGQELSFFSQLFFFFFFFFPF